MLDKDSNSYNILMIITIKTLSKFRMERKRYKKSIIWTKNILNSIYYINYQYLHIFTGLNACVWHLWCNVNNISQGLEYGTINLSNSKVILHKAAWLKQVIHLYNGEMILVK